MYNIKKKKIFFTSFLFIVFLYVGLFCLPVSQALSAGLEIAYPTIAGQTIGANGTIPELPAYLKYLFVGGTSIGFFAVFIGLVIAGIFYIISPAKPDLRAQAKERVTGAISGLLIIVLTYLIITTINPQLNIFNINKLPTTTIQIKKEDAGVYFYSTASDCPDKAEQIRTTSSISDLGNNKNKITAVNIVQGDNSYISILYDNPNFWGKCRYIDPNQACQSAIDEKAGGPFADSISVHQYDQDATSGDGVYFYRKACFTKINSKNNVTDSNGVFSSNSMVAYCNANSGGQANSGGYYHIDNNQINPDTNGGNMYAASLTGLYFVDQNGKCTVPENEQDCIKYDKNGNCASGSRRCPNLGGENLSSIIINGNYLVLFVYVAPGDIKRKVLTSCQEFPTIGDINQFGPQQIKWENIRNNNHVLPNYVVIMPIKK